MSCSVEDDPWVVHSTNNAIAMRSVHIGASSVNLFNFAISVRKCAVMKKNRWAIAKAISITCILDAGILTFRYTIVAPGFCSFCLGDKDKKQDERFQQWLAKASLLNHIDNHIDALRGSVAFFCPHPCCQRKGYKDVSSLRRHFFDAHSIEEPRSNCVNRKRKWQSEPELKPEIQISQAIFDPADA
ncbi:hypothetical protein N7467_006913 [Penicillium canescens]|nr:hypothetical protein N7467_006913 [Penicillium canescens]